jgi:predicted RNA binding protein YcfA (HicA-like mRNA interferase family)
MIAVTAISGGLYGRNRERYVTVREVIRLLEEDGWYLVVQKGSHRQYKHPSKLGRVTVAGAMKDDLAPGTLNSILKQAGLKE